MNRAIIISNGLITNYEFIKNKLKDTDYIISADGATNHISKLNIVPNVIIGDFDSIDSSILKEYENKGVKILGFKKDKDETDTDLAVKHALELGFKDILMFGCTGDRFDHTFANVSLLRMLINKDINASISDYKNEIYLIKDKIKLEGKEGDYLSLLPLSEKVEGVTTEGLKFPLKDAEIIMGKTIGISNEFISSKAIVHIRKGLLLVIKSKD